MRLAFLLAVTFVCAYLFGLYSHAREIWPVDIVRQLKRWADPPRADVGRYKPSQRLIAYPGKTEVACPAPAASTAVILAIGQSNAANAGARKVTTRYPDRMLNYFDGKCYVAASPLLGASSEGGEFLTLLTDDLIEAGTYRGVIIVSAAHGGSPVSRWRRNGDLNQRLLSTLKAPPPGYNVTVWRSAGVTSSKSLSPPDNPIADGQRAVIDNRRVFLGADTDALLGTADRREDKCHLSDSGQTKTAAACAQAIKAYRRSP